MESLVILSKLLQDPDEFPWNEAVYLHRDGGWNPDSLAAVWSPDDCEEDSDPEIAVANNLKYALNVSSIQDIVANALEQKPECSIHDLFNAFMFYYKNDAFIKF